MKTIVRFLALLGLFTLLVIAGTIAGLIMVARGAKHVPEHTILELDLETGLAEWIPDDVVAQGILGGSPSLRDVVDALDTARRDDRVRGLLATFGGTAPALAQIQELRDAIKRFRDAGKMTVAYSETFGEAGPGNAAYYLASAFEKIVLQPSGDVGLTGMLAESPFVKGALAKLGIEARGDHRYEYKNAWNMFSQESFTDAHREATTRIMESRFSQMVRDIARDRKLEESRVRELFDRGPLLGSEAVAAGLVDEVAYRDGVDDLVRKGRPDADFMPLADYLAAAGRPHTSGTTIALIYGTGAVVRGTSGFDPLFQDSTMGSKTVTKAFQDAIDDDDVKAILFRVDSPGGSYVASDSIWREVVRAKEKGKPVVVSMGNVAGSGGYFVAMSADAIVAQPGTITGSIGVLNMKMLTRGMWDKIGITWDEVHTGAASTIPSGLHDFTPEQWQSFQHWLDRIYEDFTTKVAEGRRLPIEKVREIARGRVWTGEDAKGIGLVDELGGMDTALAVLRGKLTLGPEDAVKLRVFPVERSFLEKILERGGSPFASVRGIVQRAKPLTEIAGAILREPEAAVLAMPYGWR
jgi:protease-4